MIRCDAPQALADVGGAVRHVVIRVSLLLPGGGPVRAEASLEPGLTGLPFLLGARIDNVVC